jgi:hypothetical protein
MQVDADTVLLYLPIEHCTQTEELVAPANVGLAAYVPAWHTVQNVVPVWEVYFDSVQLMQAVEEAAMPYLPNSQGMHLVELAAPTNVAYVPDWHAMQADEPVADAYVDTVHL